MLPFLGLFSVRTWMRIADQRRQTITILHPTVYSWTLMDIYKRECDVQCSTEGLSMCHSHTRRTKRSRAKAVCFCLRQDAQVLTTGPHHILHKLQVLPHHTVRPCLNDPSDKKRSKVGNCYAWSIPASTLNFYHIHEWMVRPATRQAQSCLSFSLDSEYLSQTLHGTASPDCRPRQTPMAPQVIGMAVPWSGWVWDDGRDTVMFQLVRPSLSGASNFGTPFGGTSCQISLPGSSTAR